MVEEPGSPAQMAALQNNPDLSELLLHQRAEDGKRWDLVHSLLYMGRHDEARRVAKGEEQLTHIDHHQLNIQKPDDEECKCEHTPTILQPLKHAVATKSWSEKHNGIVYHYRCHYCGHTNARPTPPDTGHDVLAMLQKQREGLMHRDADRDKRTTAREVDGRLIDDRQLVEEINRRGGS